MDAELQDLAELLGQEMMEAEDFMRTLTFNCEHLLENVKAMKKYVDYDFEDEKAKLDEHFNSLEQNTAFVKTSETAIKKMDTEI